MCKKVPLGHRTAESEKLQTRRGKLGENFA